MPTRDPFGARASLGPGLPDFYRLAALADGPDLGRTPTTVKILLENVIRHAGGGVVEEADVRVLAGWRPGAGVAAEVPFMPARVILQDFTGVPAVVDLAAMRDALAALGGDPARVNPLVPADLVIDHSVQVDRFGTADALAFNVAREYERNGERYQLLRWAQRAFRGLRVVPPGTGIVHQVNLEYLATVVSTAEVEGGPVAFPDTLVGTDSHTTMVNALGVLGYGVGGIEAEAVLLGQPLHQPFPRVVGVRLSGEMPRGATATDLVLVVTEQLRRLGVVGSFVEFAGDGLAGLPLADRATISNMSPEFGATTTIFPIDDETLAYLRLTGRAAGLVDLVERYAKEQGLWREPGAGPAFDDVLELDLGTVEPSLAGPRRPQDRVPLRATRASFEAAYPGILPAADAPAAPGSVRNGSVVIAAITSCTNTSNPTVMIGAGLLARNAVARGLRVPSTVKTTLAPGSRAVTAYLDRAGLSAPLAALGFALAGYGCTTCIGNSGPLDEAVAHQVEAEGLVAAAVLSGNRNFEGRIHPLARASYLASPPLVVAFALAGRIDLDLSREPLGIGDDGRPVFLADLWPTAEEIRATIAGAIDGELFRASYASVFEGDERWQALPIPEGDRYAWDPGSTYVALPPFFAGMGMEPAPVVDIAGARVLAWLGDSVTTDHISPAGSIPAWSPAGGWLQGQGRRAGRLQLVRRTAWPPRGHDAGHVREHPPAQSTGRREGGSVHPDPARRARRRSSTTPPGRTRPPGSRPSSWPAASTAQARRATGPPRGRGSSGSGPSSPRATSGSTARTWSGWASSRSSSWRARAPSRWGSAAASRTRSPAWAWVSTPRARLDVVATADPADGGGERRFDRGVPARRSHRGRLLPAGWDPARGPAADRRRGRDGLTRDGPCCVTSPVRPSSCGQMNVESATS